MLAEMWEEHRTAPFPPECRGRKVEGVDLLRLDAGVAGVVQIYLTDHVLTGADCALLTQCVSDLERVIPALEGESRAHFGRLQGMAGMLLHHCQADTPGEAAD